MKSLYRQLGALFGAAIIFAALDATAQTNRPIFTENLVNNFSTANHKVTFSVSNTSPVHTGSYSISATITGSGGYVGFQHNGFSSNPYESVSFWINGGPSGGQLLSVYGLLNGTPETFTNLPALTANVWQQIVVPLSVLGCSNQPGFSGFRIENATSSALPVFYLDDVYLDATPATLVQINIFANDTNRMADARWFGVNTAIWDSYLGNSATVPALLNSGILNLRWPGGSEADVYNWSTQISQQNTFNAVATNLGPQAQAYITVNYGSGTSNLAAAWVLFDNVTNHCNYKYWEIGNECYGTWETDDNTNNGQNAHDPYTYAVRAAGYMALMRAADPTIKIGVVAAPGDDNYANGYSSHPAYNSRTGAYHNGWVPVMLSTLKSLGARPDFLIHHVYPQYTAEPLPASPPPPPCVDSDMFLLQYSTNWELDALTYQQEISDYWGPGTTNIELCATENNSDSSLGGKQLSSLVNALYEADSLGRLMKTPFNSYLWWDLRNGDGTGGELDASLYGWRQYGDEGLITGATGYNPVYYGMKMMQYFARPGDAIINATSDYQLLSAYAARQSNGTVKVMVINKDPVGNFTAQLNFTDFTPGANVIVRSYGESQDNATEAGGSTASQDVATTTVGSVENPFTCTFPPYSITVLTFPASPAVNIQPAGTNIVLTWQGPLLQAPNLTGPWTAASATSPSTVTPTNSQMFYAVQSVATPISINFSGSGTVMGASESAGAVTETNWNNAALGSGISMTLNDANGNATGATVTWSANGVGNTTVANNPGNNRMMRNYLNTGNTTTTTVTVSGLPMNSSGWTVYVYCDGATTQTCEGAYTISGAGLATTTVDAFDPANTDFSGNYTQAANSAGNYVVYSIPNVLGFTLSATPVANGASSPRAPMNGIQIIPN